MSTVISEFVVPIYSQGVKVILDSDECDIHTSSAFIKEDLDNSQFDIYLSSTDINSITHEVFHLTIMMMDHMGIQFDVENHEAFADLNAYLNEKIISDLGIL